MHGSELGRAVRSIGTGCLNVLLGIAYLGALVGCGWLLSNRTEVAEAFEVAACRSPCATLAPEQLRLQVIKAYLHRQLDENIERLDGGFDWRIALLPGDITVIEAAQGFRDEALKAPAIHITARVTHAQIDALTLGALANDPVIAIYSFRRDHAEIVPTRWIREASAAEVEDHFSAPRRGGTPTFSSWERRRGYGRHYFWFDSWHMDLARRDGRGDSSGGNIAQEMRKNNLSNIQSTLPRIMAISERGAILVRYYNGEALIRL